MLSALVDAASWALLVAGSGFCLVGAIGLIRMPDLYTRMHAASVTETAGAGLILLALAPQAGFTLVTAKLAILALVILFTSPAATHALARAAFLRGVAPQLGSGATEPWKA
jgi:multicomponent Na+:H+ antiporter subunit G